jgi:hypothetical protein
MSFITLINKLSIIFFIKFNIGYLFQLVNLFTFSLVTIIVINNSLKYFNLKISLGVISTSTKLALYLRSCNEY